MTTTHLFSPPQASGPELRKTPRFEITAPAYVDAIGRSSGEVLARGQRLINISLGGLCIQCEAAEEIGTEVDLVVYFPEHGPEAGVPLEVRGQVIWANRSAPCDMGIKFMKLDEQRLEMLRRYIAQVQGAQAA